MGWTIFMVAAGLHSANLFGQVPEAGDSLRPAWASSHRADAVLGDLIDVETDYRKTGSDRKALVHLLRIVRYKRISRDIRVRSRLLADLADVSAKLKLYPLAMKCYERAIRWKWEEAPYETTSAGADDSLPQVRQVAYVTDGTMGNNGAWIDSGLFQRLINIDTSERPGVVLPSRQVEGKSIWEPFEDGKTGASYALLVHVKQPVPGKRKSFTRITNVGHTFITLIKYNTDNSYVSRSFGFYPHKTSFFAATPLHPASPSVFKNDSLHDWDEVVGKFISFQKFQRVIHLIQRYNLQEYNLNLNNCTNFGLNVALAGGISIQDTRGRWPMGRGSNPGNAGQSILEGKVVNVDGDYQQPLFISKATALEGFHP